MLLSDCWLTASAGHFELSGTAGRVGVSPTYRGARAAIIVVAGAILAMVVLVLFLRGNYSNNNPTALQSAVSTESVVAANYQVCVIELLELFQVGQKLRETALGCSYV